LAGDQLLHHEHVPLLVVVLGPGLGHPLPDTAGQHRPTSGTGDAPLGDPLPRAVRHLGKVLEHEELLDREPAPVQDVDRREHQAQSQPWAGLGGHQRPPLLEAEPGRLERRRAGGVHRGGPGPVGGSELGV
jgi:hypothetical protein